MRIALLGTRGIPASYSGFETCVEKLGEQLVIRGHEVFVYCRSHHITYPGSTYKGARLIKLQTIPNKYLDTLVHSFFSSLHALPQKYDIALYFIAGNSPVTWIPRLVGTKTILNVDGLDWKREKWPALAKKYIQFAEYLATILPTTYLTDSHIVQDYYQSTYGTAPPYIPYGSDIEMVHPGDTLEKFGLTPQNYILFVGRLVPENCIHHLIEAYDTLNTDLKCVIVGDSTYSEAYKTDLRQRAAGNPNIIFTGYVFGKGYHELGSNACIFVETSGVGGTHPALVEAMAFGNCVIAHDTPENLETLDTAGLSYNGKEGASSLAHLLTNLLSQPTLIAEYRHRARVRAQTTYTWKTVTDSYERLFYEILDRPIPQHLTQIHPLLGKL